MSNKKISQFTQVQQTDPNTTEIPLIQGNPFQNVTISVNDLVQDLKDNYDIAVGDLQGEISERISADISLSTQISNEISERLSVELSLSSALSAEISDTISAVTILSNGLSTETSQRISADTSLTTLLSSNYVPYSGANKDVNLGNHTISLDGIKLDTTTPYVVQNPGEIGWNSVEGTLDLRLLNNTTLQLGQEIHTYGRAVGNILNGDPVQFAGVQGDHILIKTANAIEIEQNPYLLIGIATQNITAGNFGYVTYFGKVNGIYTEDWVSKDEIYFDPVLNGLTNVKPSVPNRVIKVGYLIKAQTGQAENGILKVKISYGTKLTDLDDVNGTLPTKGTFPIFQDEGYFDFTHNINDYALTSSLSTETSQRISSDSSLTSRISTGLSTEMSQRVSTDISLSSELSLTTAIAKGAQQGMSFLTYGDMVYYLMNIDYAQLNIGQSIYIKTLEVPDVWISGQPLTPAPYIYFDDQTLIDDVNYGGGQLQIGYAIISFLETQKVDLTNYVTDTQLSTTISTEASDRILADTSLSSALSTAILTEESIRLSVDQSLSSALSTEISDSISANNILSNSISSEISDRISGDLSLSTELSSEISRALSAESSLSTAISSGGGGGDVSAEASIRLSVDQSLSTALSTEISERISTDLSLSTAISSGGGGGGTSETFVDITLLSSNWISNTQTITAVGVTTSNTITVYAPLNRDQYLEYGRCQISATSQGADTLTFTNSENPLFDISLKISYR